MNDTDRILVHLLAEGDAVWSPLRRNDWDARHASGVYFELRRDFASDGFPFFGPGGTATDRKRYREQLARLQAKKLVWLGGKERSTRARLTDQGDWHARALCGLPLPSLTYRQVRELIRRGGAENDWALAGLKRYTASNADFQAVVREELIALPGLTRGWLTSSSTTEGHAAYFVTEAGRRLTEADAQPPARLPKERPGASAAYDAAWLACRGRHRIASPHDPREIGPIPMIGCLAFGPMTKASK